MPSEISRMLPGMPLCPYGIFSGSTSMVLPLGRKVTLYFFVAGLYLTSSMYGLLPPMIYPPKDGGIKPPLQLVTTVFDGSRYCSATVGTGQKPVLPKKLQTSASLRPSRAVETAEFISNSARCSVA